MNTASSLLFRAGILSACLLFVPVCARAQDTTLEHRWKFLPAANRFRPLAANWQEARLGISKQVGSSKLKLDIGAALEFIQFRPTADADIRMGVEFFAYGLSTNVGESRLQIDAIDGHFGGSVAAAFAEPWGTLTARLRIMHLSSHFVDGHVRDNWISIDGRDPTAFTRDFGELVVAPEVRTGDWDLRPYAGVSYSTLVRPDDLARWGGCAGAEVFCQSFPHILFGKASALFAALHATLAGVPEYTLSTAMHVGIHLGEREGAAIRVYGGYFLGNDIFHQYYKLRREYWSLGVSFEVR